MNKFQVPLQKEIHRGQILLTWQCTQCCLFQSSFISFSFYQLILECILHQRLFSSRLYRVLRYEQVSGASTERNPPGGDPVNTMLPLQPYHLLTTVPSREVPRTMADFDNMRPDASKIVLRLLPLPNVANTTSHQHCHACLNRF
ncbi:hypothetical protein AVEN_55240-1 [Araneus ventricosus]|uniref:Uncharacterized protein n=1 Tax=Araneus ventricosus TaxID=182803 RepID=A0A4Y2TZL6_ARAVE|nr:hypothetical protein AVEN_55240-1 [Araneus ventricosus]